MNSKVQKTGGIVFAIVLIIVCGVWFFKSDLKHIEDTNGADNYALQEITDKNIIDLDMGSLGGPNEKHDNITNTTTYYAKKFTGVSEIFGENLKANRFEIIVNFAQVDEGNFRMVLVENDEIVHEFTLNELTQSYVLEDVSGYVALRVAGESAKFQFDYHIL